MRWVVSVKGVLCAEGAVLLALNDRDEWELPGGQLEEGERPQDAVVRELAEETALKVRAGRLVHADTFEVIPGRSVLILAYRCAPAGPLDAAVSDEHRELRWVPLDGPDGLDAIRLPQVYRDAIDRAAD